MSDEENEVFSGSVTSEPQMVNVQTSGPMYVVERSSAPQVIGILVIVYNLIMTALGLFGLAALAFLSDLDEVDGIEACLLYTSPSPRDATLSRMPSSA